jgi:hypothetical protein
MLAGNGAIVLNNVGSGTALGDISIVGAADVTANGTITASSLGIANGRNVTLAGGAISLAGAFSSSGRKFDNTGAPISTNGNAVSINHSGVVNIGSAIDSANGNVSITGNTSFEVADAVLVDAGSGSISLNSKGDITLTGGLLTTSNATNAVSITSSAGSIVDGGDNPAYDVDAVNGTLTMKADRGIGDGNPLEIRASSIKANVTRSGDIGLEVNGTTTLSDVTTQNGVISVITIGGSLHARNVQSGGDQNITLDSDVDMTLGTVSAGIGKLTLEANGDIDGGSLQARTAVINAATAGANRSVTLDVNENRVFVNLTAKNARGISGVFDAGPALNAKPPRSNLTALGTVIFEGLGTFLAGELADIEGAITSLATASKEQEILDEMLRAAREAQYFMTAPLEIFIEMEDEEKEKRKDEEEGGEEAFNRILPLPGQYSRPPLAPTRPTLLSELPPAGRAGNGSPHASTGRGESAESPALLSMSGGYR